ncbi:cyclic peptide export ABC transporter [Aquimarina sp. RZ0]|uniref:cyclic peptide export ABC transporter n=1 Tax=Aquimarina sp. RZ0 TaxID=2607730 RepID=UPI0011F1102E|nr:cyclic peptide export ABC transporter [Aquimarina sp. RZ0]KAA1243807.1 cyclic peptide export ABC transporter [Aquimarina sp. RZ0]
MGLLKIIFLSTSKPRFYLITVFGCVVGLINIYIVSLITSYIEMDHKDLINNIILFSTVIAIYLITNILFSNALVIMSQKGIKTIKEKIFEVSLRSKYGDLSKNKKKIFSIYSDDMEIIVGSYTGIIYVIVAIASVFFAFVYLAWLSIPLFLITLGIISLGFLSYYYVVGKAVPHFKGARTVHNIIINYLFEILNGFKELKIYPHKKADIKSIVAENITQSYYHNKRSHSIFAMTNVIGNMVLFLYLGAILLIVPLYMVDEKPILLDFSLIILYVFTPIGNIMSLINPLSKANIIADKMISVIGEMKEAENEEDLEMYSGKSNFHQLSLHGLTYNYGKNDEENFELGPIDMEINKNEVVFIFGGNGSGKTTLMHSILNLYSSSFSKISFNDALVTTNEWGARARQLFAPVFSDFHLFQKFYGINDIDQVKVKKYLSLFEIDQKVNVKDHGFSTLELSTGQRKRLALINALLEDKPILFLDEWAADQDPKFRKKFYTEIVPLIVKEENKTIIAITHDDRYFNTADRLLKMEYGKLIEVDKLLLTDVL